MRPHRVLFVCTGNLCRSAAAAAIFQSLATQRGVEVVADSAGTAAMWDMPAHSQTVEAAAEIGIDMTGHQSKPVHNELLRPPVLILGMAEEHVVWLRSIRPDLASDIHLFRCYCERRESEPSRGIADDIVDPVAKSPLVHRRVVRDICSLLERLLERWCQGPA
ncbi:MAG: arsenate reductase/protein-tyrosine-phosphatase family protein [Candidatus Xenobia bacterium]